MSKYRIQLTNYSLITEITNFFPWKRLRWPVAMMLGYVKNRQPVLSHSYPGQVKRYVVTSKTCHSITSILLCQQMHNFRKFIMTLNNISKSMSNYLKVCHESKCRKVHHDVKSFVMTSKISSWCLKVWKVCYGIKKCTMMSRISSWHQKVCHDVQNILVTIIHYTKCCSRVINDYVFFFTNWVTLTMTFDVFPWNSSLMAGSYPATSICRFVSIGLHLNEVMVR